MECVNIKKCKNCGMILKSTENQCIKCGVYEIGAKFETDYLGVYESTAERIIRFEIEPNGYYILSYAYKS